MLAAPFQELLTNLESIKNVGNSHFLNHNYCEAKKAYSSMMNKCRQYLPDGAANVSI